MLDIPKFESVEKRREWFINNKSMLLTEKKTQFKTADIVNYIPKGAAVKAVNKATNKLTVKAAINTVNVLDSHGDVHLKGIWNKTVKENKSPYLLQEHKMAFESIISDKVTPSVANISWSDLGIKAVGSTEVLMFEAEIEKERNEFMFNQYKNGWVKNHSVGMQYVKIKLAVNDPEMKEEYEEWEKTYNSIINKEQADQLGYYFTVYEAKMIEGSAVPIGSNSVTPTLETKDNEPSKDTQKEKPSVDTSQMMNRFL